MTNRELLERICEERGHDLEILTRQKIIEEYLAPDIPSVEDFCGWDMNENYIAYFIIAQTEPCFVFVRDDEDITEEQACDILDWLGEDYELFLEVKNSLQ